MRELLQYIEENLYEQIRSRKEIAAREGVTVPFPTEMHPEIVRILKKDGIDRLYRHQEEAFHSIREDKHTLLVSSTASGKTFSFFLPVLNKYLEESSPFSVLLLYPTKALSRDQEGTFGRLMSVVNRDGRLGTFDGDTPRDERNRIQRSADFIITNPDMLHGGILPNHNRKWRDILSRLRYVIIDEVHIYRGAFGSHVANVFRRLRRICAIHGSDPVFICSSATVGNPTEHVRGLFGVDFHVVDRDTSPRPARTTYFINPSLVKSAGHALYRKGPGSVTVPLIREAARRKIRTIVFCRARQEVERLHRAVTDRNPEIAARVKPYRGGLLPGERRALERDLAEGRISVIISTNALELGIDIGDLEFCVLSGHPGTVASFHQQSGRVGRRGTESLVVYVARDTPVDQYIVHHPEFIEESPVESARLNAENPYILLQHLPCAAHEYPLSGQDGRFFGGMVFEEAMALLKKEGTLLPYREALRYGVSDYPARGVNLRGMTDYNVEIYCGTEVIGELDPIGARGTLYRDAIYQHLGKRYMSMELDLEKKLCRVEPVDVDYYTEAHWESRITMNHVYEKKDLYDGLVTLGEVNVNRQPKLYKKIRERTFENIGYGPITLPPFEYDTVGFSLLAPGEWIETMNREDIRFIGAAFHGLAYILPHASSVICMADPRDLGTDVSLNETTGEEWKSSLFLYDAIEGGVGYSEKVFEMLPETLVLVRDIIRECECESGCPSCVPSLPPGVDSATLEYLLVESDASRVCTLSLLDSLLEGDVKVPRVQIRSSELEQALIGIEPDEERQAVRGKLDRASDILRKKRERIH